LIACHKQFGVGFYLPNLGAFFSTTHAPDVQVSVTKDFPNGVPRITWRYETPLGVIERKRSWQACSYSWAIEDWGVKCEKDLKILACALSRRQFTPQWDRWRAWAEAVGSMGVVYLPVGYSGMGQLLNYWMGIETTMFAVADYPELVREVVDQINQNNLALIDLIAESPAEIVLMGDNFSGDIQPPRFFEAWSKHYYAEAIRRLHQQGKFVAVHIDGRLRGSLKMLGAVGADCADAVTPTPMGDLTPAECRREAGPDFILSGGVSPNLWLPGTPVEDFKQAVLAWLDLNKNGSGLIANAGDQVPPNAAEERIELMRDLVEAHGKY
jgi:hypothetical protein